MIYEIKVKTKSENNMREHWGARAQRRKAQRYMAKWATWEALGQNKRGALGDDELAVIVLTRISPRGLDDDNLAGSLKAVRDGIADGLRVDDGDARLTWGYRQEKGKPQAVRVEISFKEGGEE